VALGGQVAISAQRSAILADAVALGIILRAEFSLWCRDRDPEAAQRVTACARARQLALTSIGLDRVAHDVSLRSYLDARAKTETPENRAGTTIGEMVDAVVVPAPERTAAANGGSDPSGFEGATPCDSTAEGDRCDEPESDRDSVPSGAGTDADEQGRESLGDA
jgi:hypothetical protein